MGYELGCPGRTPHFGLRQHTIRKSWHGKGPSTNPCSSPRKMSVGHQDRLFPGGRHEGLSDLIPDAFPSWPRGKRTMPAMLEDRPAAMDQPGVSRLCWSMSRRFEERGQSSGSAKLGQCHRLTEFLNAAHPYDARLPDARSNSVTPRASVSRMAANMSGARVVRFTIRLRYARSMPSRSATSVRLSLPPGFQRGHQTALAR